MLTANLRVTIVLLTVTALPGARGLAWAQTAGETPTGSIQELYSAGSQALNQGNLSAAEKYFQAVLARQPQDPGSNANLGVIYMRRQQWPAALRY